MKWRRSGGNGLSPTLILSSLHRAPDPLCYQHCLWKPVQCPAGPTSSWIIGMTLSLLLICETPLPPRMQSRLSSSPPDMQLLLKCVLNSVFKVTCANVTMQDKIPWMKYTICKNSEILYLMKMSLLCLSVCLYVYMYVYLMYRKWGNFAKKINFRQSPSTTKISLLNYFSINK